jgi:hypothetical protein
MGQSGYIEGLDIENKNAIKLCAEDENIETRVTWVDPITKKDVVLFSHSTEVNQQQPVVSFVRAKMTYSNSNLEEGQIEISGIQIVSAQQTCESKEYAALDFAANASGDIAGRTPNSKYTYKLGQAKIRPNYEKGNMSADITVVIPFRLSPNETVNRRDKQIALSGSVSVVINTSAVNEKNKKRSRVTNQTQSFGISTTLAGKK